MARQLRLDFPGALWHIFGRGNERKSIFREDRDRKRFLGHLSEVTDDFRWRLYCYCLMTNHYHLVIESVEGNLSRAMQALNSRYAQQFNQKYSRVGHLFQGRFRGVLVEKETHLLELIRYVVLNPVRARLVRSAADWRWSSYRATAGLEPAPPWLSIDAVLAQFGPQYVQDARRMYRNFVKEGESKGVQPELEPCDQICIGSDTFKLRIRDLARLRTRSMEHPLAHREPWRPGINQILSAVSVEFGRSPEEIRSFHGGTARVAVAYLARHDGIIPNPQVGRMLGLKSSSAVTRLVQEGDRLGGDEEFATKLAAIRSRIMIELENLPNEEKWRMKM